MSVFDAQYPVHERFPDQFVLHFTPQEVRGWAGMYIEAEVDGQRFPFGDMLTDNAHNEDGYRYHDIFHVAFAVHLGWSPNTRAFLSRKRKSVPNVDEVEDGARARAIEEAVSAAIFAYMTSQSFKPVHHEKDIQLFHLIQQLVVGREVQTCDVMEWVRAIESGYDVFSQVRIGSPISLVCDMERQKLTVIKTMS
jgi:hypothetical protein